ncbi:MAG: hypothetical protein ACTSO2_17520 [Promethearchaeota archaeon]
MDFDEIKKYLILGLAIGTMIFGLITLFSTVNTAAQMSNISFWAQIILIILVATDFYD